MPCLFTLSFEEQPATTNCNCNPNLDYRNRREVLSTPFERRFRPAHGGRQSSGNNNEVQIGNYIVRDEDLPIFRIYQCDLALTEVGMRELLAGERNGSIGEQPVVDPERSAAAEDPVR